MHSTTRRERYAHSRDVYTRDVFRTTGLCVHVGSEGRWAPGGGGLVVCVGGGGFGTRPWWLALLACGGAYWPLAIEPSAMTSRQQASVLLRASALPWASTFLGGNPEYNFCPWRPPLTA